MTSPTDQLRTETLELRECGLARNLPNGIWLSVREVLAFHGLYPASSDVLMAVAALIDKTPVADGGRLLPDGSVDRT